MTTLILKLCHLKNKDVIQVFQRTNGMKYENKKQFFFRISAAFYTNTLHSENNES
jgi:hypothetical protein